jgi:hypothetical protein
LLAKFFTRFSTSRFILQITDRLFQEIAMTATTNKTSKISLNQLWEFAPLSTQVFQPASLTYLPATARLYLEHAIKPGTKMATAVRLWMHGEIKLGHQWHHFTGEEVICWQRGMIWRATTWMQGLPIWGADRVIDGLSDVQWKMLGLFPVMKAAGPDVTRSGIGRMQGESVWLPSVLCNPAVTWIANDAEHLQANFTALGERAEILLTIDRVGSLQQVKFQRWGNPSGGQHHYIDFGGIVEAERTFDGYTIPTKLRLGWCFGSDRFESEGEFFRCTIDRAVYR